MTKFNHKPSQTYLRALTALQELMKEEGADAVTRACADITWEDSKTTFAQRGGLKESSKSASIERLIGKRPGTSRRFADSARPLVLPADDHPSLWLKDKKPHAYVSQPYALTFDQAKKLVLFCEQHGLRFDVTAWQAWYFPGHVLNIEIRKSDVPEETS